MKRPFVPPGTPLRFRPSVLFVRSAAAAALALAAHAVFASTPERNGGSGVAFVPNDGQLDARVAFHASTSSGRVFVLRDGRIVHALREAGDGPTASTWALRETLLGSNLSPRGSGQTPTRVSSFLGNDPACWRTALPTYDRVDLGVPWPGIAVSVRMNAGRAEKVFHVEAGASAADIAVRVEGARRLRLGDGGELVAETGLGEVTLSAPVAYQEIDASRVPVVASYELTGDRYGFRLGPHDPSLPITIDPILIAIFIGGSGGDNINDVAVDPSTGDVYVVGTTSSSDLPFVTDAAQSIPNDSFVARLQGDLGAYYQSTYLGGGSADVGKRIAVHPTTGEIIVAGSTLSTDFPAANFGAQDFEGGKWDAFAARLTPNLLNLNGSTYFGGTEDEQFYLALAIDPVSGDIYLAGETKSTSLLGLTGAAQTTAAGGVDGFLVGFDPDLGDMVRSSFYGGTGDDYPFALTIDATNGVFIGGFTNSATLPNTFGSGQPSFSGGFSDAFVALFKPDLTQLKRSIYLGGSGADLAFGLGIHPTSGELYVAGRTNSLDMIGRIGGAQPSLGTAGDDFLLARLDPSLTLLKQTTYLGGDGNDAAYWVGFDAETGDVFAAGFTSASDFPGREGGAQSSLGGWHDAVVARLNPELTKLLQSSYYGSLGDDILRSATTRPSTNEVLLAGSTTSIYLPGALSSVRPVLNGSSDGFVARLTPELTSALSPVGAVPIGLTVDPEAGFYSDGNGMLEPGEVVKLQTSWKNVTHTSFAATGQLASLTGPAPGGYFLPDDSGSYGTIAPGAIAPCTAAFDCYAISVTQPAGRPATHWDASLQETLDNGDEKFWSLHVGNSFSDVLRTQPFYAKIETLLHLGVTSGCTPTTYCPSQTVTRDQMAIFLAKVVAKGANNILPQGTVNGAGYYCGVVGGSLFTDVQTTDPFCRHVHYLAAWGITRGCAADQYCPSAPVDRGAMAAFLVRALTGQAAPPVRNSDPVTGRSYNCQAGTPSTFFTDVPPTHPFCAPIHYLWARGFVAGCGADTYCPSGTVTRDAMAKFLVNTFDMKLYGP